jgi:hypothetical protein
MRCAAWAIVAVMLAAGLGGCARGGNLTITSTVDGSALVSDFDFAVYQYRGRNAVDVVMVKGTDDAPQQLVHVRMYWVARAARTPTSVRATNTTISYVIFEGDQAGVYGGGGMLFPSRTATGGTFSARLENAALRLMDASGEFAGDLKLADAAGSFRATYDPGRALRLLRKAEVMLRQRLGYPRFVESTIDDLRSSVCQDAASGLTVARGS